MASRMGRSGEQELEEFSFSTTRPTPSACLKNAEYPQYFMCSADELFLNGKIRPLMPCDSHCRSYLQTSTSQSIRMYEPAPHIATLEVHDDATSLDYYQNSGQSFLPSSFFKASISKDECHASENTKEQGRYCAKSIYERKGEDHQDSMLRDRLLSENQESAIDGTLKRSLKQKHKKKKIRKQLMALMLFQFNGILPPTKRFASKSSSASSSSACSSPSWSSACTSSRQEHYNHRKRRTFLPYRQSLLACFNTSPTLP